MNVGAFHGPILQPRNSREHDGIAVAHPSGVALIVIPRNHFSRCATLDGHYEYLPGLSWSRCHKYDLSSIRRPARNMGLHGRIRKLGVGASIEFAAPQCKFRMCYVGDPLAVARDVG